MSRILVTPRSLTRDPDPALGRLEEDGHALIFCRPGEMPDEAELLALLPGCVGWIAGVEPISPRVLKAAAGLRAISRNGSGTDNIPLEIASTLGIRILTAPAANARGVAELAIALALAGMRHVPASHAALRDGNWQRRSGIEIEGRLFGVIGCGAVGRLVARLALALGARVRAFDPCPDASFRPDGDFAWVDLATVMREAEILSLHCPVAPGAAPLLDARAVAGLRPGVHLINTARAGLVDETVLLAALERGHVRVYATDVFRTEPPEPSALLRHPGVIATPHIGGLTEESVRNATVAAVENLRRALAA